MFCLRLTLASVIVFASCTGKNATSANPNQLITVGSATLQVPASFKYVKGRGIDSYVAFLITEKNDTFQVEFGGPHSVYRLFEKPPVAFPVSVKAQVPVDTSLSDPGVVFTNSYQEDNEEGILMPNYYLYDTINKITVKIVQPKKMGHGLTGLFVPDLPHGNALSIYAMNLDSAEHKRALMIFHSLKLKQ